MINEANHLDWYFWTGLVAAVCIAVYMMPQMIRTIKTKDTVGISVIMLSLAVIGDLFFCISGLGTLTNKNLSTFQRVSAGLPLFLANLFGLIISAINAFFKFRNMHRAKKMNITEKDFCANYKENVETYKRNFANNKEEKKETLEN